MALYRSVILEINKKNVQSDKNLEKTKSSRIYKNSNAPTETSISLGLRNDGLSFLRIFIYSFR